MAETLTPAERRRIRDEYNWILNIAVNDPTGSLPKFMRQLSQFLKTKDGKNPANVARYVQENLKDIDAFRDMYEDQARSAIAEAQPELRAEINRTVETNRQLVQLIAEREGIPLTPERMLAVAQEAWRNGWDQDEILLNLRSDLDTALQSGENLMGEAGDFQTRLMSWARQNGIGIDSTTAARYVANMTLGLQTFEDAKQDLRETYLIGAFPAWEDKIRQGFDPWQISSPYRSAAAALLELDPEQVGLDDPLVKMGLQSTGADGKPRIMPLYEFEQQVRNDPRWQTTDNAYRAYTRVGTDLLRMFGFR